MVPDSQISGTQICHELLHSGLHWVFFQKRNLGTSLSAGVVSWVINDEARQPKIVWEWLKDERNKGRGITHFSDDSGPHRHSWRPPWPGPMWDSS